VIMSSRLSIKRMFSIRGRVRRSVQCVVAFLLLALNACEPAPEPPPEASRGQSNPPRPDQVWPQLEARLFYRVPLRLRFEVTAEGVLAADLTGTLERVADGQITITANGDFAGENQRLGLASDGANMWIGAGEAITNQRTPAELDEAVIVGFARMGILHNLARLTGGAPPDHMEGGAERWVAIQGVRAGEAETINGRPTGEFEYELLVDGAPSGRGRLWLDLINGLPVRRNLVVEFADGLMTVDEAYEFY
jgi:hypothetical protein